MLEICFMWQTNKHIHIDVATRCVLRAVSASKWVCSLGSAPHPAEGAYSTPPEPLAGFRRKEWGGKRGREGRVREGEMEVKPPNKNPGYGLVRNIPTNLDLWCDTQNMRHGKSYSRSPSARWLILSESSRNCPNTRSSSHAMDNHSGFSEDCFASNDDIWSASRRLL